MPRFLTRLTAWFRSWWFTPMSNFTERDMSQYDGEMYFDSTNFGRVFEVSPAASKLIDSLAKDKSKSPGEILDTALALLKFVHDENTINNNKVVVTDSSLKPITEITI